MTDQNPPSDFTVPTRRRVLLSLGLALLMAVIVLITIILPAEYNLDPTGIGNALGIDVLSSAPAAIPPLPEIAQSAALPSAGETTHEHALLPQPPEEFPGMPAPAPLRNPAVIQRPGPLPKTEAIDVALAVGEEVEMKAVLAPDQMIVYAWSIAEGEVYYDFHAEPEQAPEGYFVRYAEGEGSTDGGSLVAPFAGHHGWYWLNISDHAITIRLEVTGYYTEVVEVYRGMQGF